MSNRTDYRDLHKEVSERIAAELAKGTVPWVKPWSRTPGLNQPMNAVTRRPYSGGNVLFLWIASEEHGWTLPRYLTFKQAKDSGGHVRKGEKGTEVYLVKKILVADKKSDNPDDKKSISFLRAFTVFNVSQCDNLPTKLTETVEPKVRNHDKRDPEVETFVHETGVVLEETPHGDRACYYPGIDKIHMPPFTNFKSADNFYATTFHELGHWTGHKDRLNREMKGFFGTPEYAAEELVAELTSAYLCAEFNFDGSLQHAPYIANWIKLFKDDSRAFFSAASKAQRAADYLMKRNQPEEAVSD
jgi:antirestriction protein ArdC